MDARVERERSFHDDRFGSSDGRRAERFYAVCRASFGYYEGLIYQRAAGRRVLEFGCGVSSYAIELAARDAHVTGVDISEVAVSESCAQARGTEVESRLDFRVMDAEELELDGDPYDLICGSGVLHHLDIERACASIRSHLRPEGTAVFLEPLGHNPAINAYRRLTPDQRSRDEHPLRMDDLELMFGHFGRVRIRCFHLAALLAVPARGRRGFDALLGRLEAVDDWLFSRLKPARRYAWVAVLDLSQPRQAPPSGT